MTNSFNQLPANTGVMPVSPAGNSAVFTEIATPSAAESTYEKARRAAVLAHAERKREAATKGYEYHPYSVADSDGYFLSDMEPDSAELGSVSRDSWAYPLAYVHGGLPTSMHSVLSGKAFNAKGVWERASLARIVQHVPSPVRLLDGSTVVEMPTGVMARRCMAYIASRVIETGSREFFRLRPSHARWVYLHCLLMVASVSLRFSVCALGCVLLSVSALKTVLRVKSFTLSRLRRTLTTRTWVYTSLPRVTLCLLLA